jgi:hypothetical protein
MNSVTEIPSMLGESTALLKVKCAERDYKRYRLALAVSPTHGHCRPSIVGFPDTHLTHLRLSS